MIFKIFRLRKTVREIRNDTGGFVADEVGGLLQGLLLVPVVIVALALILFFILGFTTILGGPIGFFKVLFVVGVLVTLFLGAIIYPIVRFARRSARRATTRIVHAVEDISNK